MWFSFSTIPAVFACRGAAAGRSRRRPAAGGVETLERRAVLAAVVAPTIRLAVASDTGIKNDGITSVTQPLFVGNAKAGTRVQVVADGSTVIGSAITNARGVWSVPTPIARAFITEGVRTLTATAYNRNSEASVASTLRLKIDFAPRVQNLAYDPRSGSITVGFSEEVRGMNLGRLQLTIPGVFRLPLNDPRVTELAGSITTSRPNATTYVFTPRVLPYSPGTYTLTVLKAGITDIAGNPLANGLSSQFTPARLTG